ncbi:MAG: diguanylate cyclase [Sphingobium sp.]
MTAVTDRAVILNDMRTPIVAGLLFFALAAVTLKLTSLAGGVAMIWPANAMLVALLILRPTRQWGPILVAGFVGSVAATILNYGMSVATLLFSVANMTEVVIAASATGFMGGGADLLGNRRRTVRFVIQAALVAPAISAAIGAATVWRLLGEDFSVAYLIWLFSDAIGILIFTPFFYALFAGSYVRWYDEMTSGQRLEALLLLLLSGVVTAAVYVSHWPLLFLIMMPNTLIAFRLGWMGVQISSVVVTVLSAMATAAGHGPLVLLGADTASRAHFLQIFLLAHVLTQWPVVGTLGMRDRLMRQLEKSERSLRILAAQSSFLMLSFDVGGICRKAVGTSGLLPSRAVEDLPGVRVEDLVDEGGKVLREAHERALDEPDKFHSVEFRVGGDAGRWLEASFRVMGEEEDGRLSGTLMSVHDISESKQKNLALARFAHTDSLTGLLNRAGFMAVLDHAMASIPPGAVSLATIDVDRFKQINDGYGHLVGDAVLKEIAHRISSQVRSSDSVGRLGGDEFVILLSRTNWESVKEVCTRLVMAVGSEPALLANGEQINIAISCGVARYRPGDGIEMFMQESDLALYEAKRRGRNQMASAGG